MRCSALSKILFGICLIRAVNSTFVKNKADESVIDVVLEEKNSHNAKREVHGNDRALKKKQEHWFQNRERIKRGDKKRRSKIRMKLRRKHIRMSNKERKRHHLKYVNRMRKEKEDRRKKMNLKSRSIIGREE